MEKFLTTDELCEKFGVVRRTIERWRKEGMPYKKIKRTVRFNEREVQEWIDKQNEK